MTHAEQSNLLKWARFGPCAHAGEGVLFAYRLVDRHYEAEL
jgi:hypothetical protein